LAGEAKLTDDAGPRGDLVAQADFEVKQAQTLVAEMLKQFGILADTLLAAEELAMLSEDQKLLAELAGRNEDDAPVIDVSKLAPIEMSDEEWAKTQAEIADEMGKMVSERPDALKEMTERDKEQARSLVAEAKKLANEHQLMQKQTRKLAELDKKIKALAARQEALARSTAAKSPIKQTAKAMKSALDDMRTGKLAEAIARQTQAESQLDKLTKELAQRSAAASLAGQADEAARKQKKIASEAKGADEALTKAVAARDKAQAERKAAEQAVGAEAKKLSAELADLKKRQGECCGRLVAGGYRQRKCSGQESRQAGRRPGEQACPGR